MARYLLTLALLLLSCADNREWAPPISVVRGRVVITDSQGMCWKGYAWKRSGQLITLYGHWGRITFSPPHTTFVLARKTSFYQATKHLSVEQEHCIDFKPPAEVP